MRGDGTCASGALNLALLDMPGCIGDTMEKCRTADAVQQFKYQVVQLVQTWSDDQWCARVDKQLRDEMWEPGFRGAYGGCTSCWMSGLDCPCRTAAAERAVFLQRCAEQSYHMTPAYFSVVAVLMQVGVLLIINDTRVRGEIGRQVYAFGVSDYCRSVVIYGAWPYSTADGHYETVGLAAPSTVTRPPAQNKPSETPYRTTSWPRGNPLLERLLKYARGKHFSSGSPSGRDGVNLTEYTGVLLTSGETGWIAAAASLNTGVFAVNEDGQEPASHRKPSSPASNRTTPHTSGQRLRPSPLPSHRARQSQEDSTIAAAHTMDASKTNRREKSTARRSLNAAMCSSPAAAGTAPKRSHSLPVTSAPHTLGLEANTCPSLSTETDSHSSVSEQATYSGARSPAQTAAFDTAEQHDLMAASVTRNVQAWVRSHARRGRLASRVHMSVVPMWTLRCRTILLRLSSALQAEPPNEKAVIGCLCALWALPMAVFSVPSRNGGGASRRKQRIRRVHHRLNDEHLVDRIMSAVLPTSDSEQHAGGRRTESGTDDQQTDDSDADTCPLLCAALSAATASPPGVHHHNERMSWDGLTDAHTAQTETESESDHDVSLSSSDSDSGGVSTAVPLGRKAASVRRSQPGDSEMVKRAEKMFAVGDTSRAMQALSSTTTLADLDDQKERDTLRALHPAASLPGPVAVMPRCPDTPELAVNYAWMYDAMKRSDTGATPGPSGYASNFLSVLAADVQCVHAMAVLIQRIVNNTLPSVVRTVLTTCIVVSLGKDNGGRRPIAIGDMFYRLASQYALSLVVRPAQSILAPHQYGVCQPDGCTQVVQSIQHLLTTPTVAAHAPTAAVTEGPYACLSVDIKNAFNAVDRASMLRVIYALPELRACWRMVAFGYGQPSLLLMQCDDSVDLDDSIILSRTGVRQGDPLAPLMFSLAMHSVYESVAKVVSGGCYAYVDDGNAVGQLKQCWDAWETVQVALRPLGLEVNAAKCELTCFDMGGLPNDEDRAALARFTDAGLKVNTDSVNILGCVIARSNEVASRVLRTDPKFRDSHAAAFRRLRLMKKQTAILALQRLDGVVLTNRLRAIPTAATAEHAATYDQEVLLAVRTLTGITSAHGVEYDEQLCSPLGYGGFGLARARQIAPAAYLAGAENTLRHSPAFATVWADPDTAAVLPPSSTIYTAIDDSLREVADLQAALSTRCDADTLGKHRRLDLPASAAHFIQHFRCARPIPIQHSISHRITTLCYIARLCEARRLGKAGEATVARLCALKEPGSALWLSTLPTLPSLTLTDIKWLWAAQLRLGVPLAVTADTCDACKAADIYTTDSWHSLTCVSRSGARITHRHDSILHEVAKYCRLISVQTEINPAGESDKDGRRADIEVYLPDRTIVGDVTVSHPATKTWRKKVSRWGVNAVGDSREGKKNERYRAMADQHDKKFQAIVMYTYGGLHTSARKFIKAICDSLDPALCLLSHTEFRAELYAHIAIALQRGNAEIMIEDTQRKEMHRAPQRHALSQSLSRAQRTTRTAWPAAGHSRRRAGEVGAWLMRSAGEGVAHKRLSAGEAHLPGHRVHSIVDEDEPTSTAAVSSGHATEIGTDSCDMDVALPAARHDSAQAARGASLVAPVPHMRTYAALDHQPIQHTLVSPTATAAAPAVGPATGVAMDVDTGQECSAAPVLSLTHSQASMAVPAATATATGAVTAVVAMCRSATASFRLLLSVLLLLGMLLGADAVTVTSVWRDRHDAGSVVSVTSDTAYVAVHTCRAGHNVHGSMGNSTRINEAWYADSAAESVLAAHGSLFGAKLVGGSTGRVLASSLHHSLVGGVVRCQRLHCRVQNSRKLAGPLFSAITADRSFAPPADLRGFGTMTKDWRCCDPAHCPGSTCVRSRRERKAARVLKTDTAWPLPPDSRDGDVRVICSKCRKRRGGSVGAERPAVPPNPPPVDHAADAGAAASLPAATATVPAIAAAASVTAPVTVTPLAYQVAVDIPCLTRDTGLFVTDAHVLRSLYSHSADDAHPGLTFWMLLPPDFPLTAAVPIRPPHYALLATRTDQAFHMPVVPFDLPARDCTELGLVGTQLYTPKKRKRGEVDTIERAGVLELVRVPHASRRQSQRSVVWIVYHQDMEEFTAWQTAEWFELSEAEEIACAIRSPFNPHRFAFDPANLCVLVPEIDFPGFSAPSWYVKMLGSFFCLHVEQLFAPFYNICYEGSTTWWVVRTEDRE